MKYDYDKSIDLYGNDELMISYYNNINDYKILTIHTDKEQKIVHMSFRESHEDLWYINTENVLSYEMTEEIIKKILEFAEDAIPEYTPEIIRTLSKIPKQEIRL